MFKIHDDKVYFVAETPNINKVIEIFLPKDDRGTIMDSHEIRVDVCRYDIVEGPMADDTIWNYVNDFLSGDISREAFWALAKFKHPTHQISFHTEVALKCLSFKEAIEV